MSDTITFNGRTYRRYPKATQRSHRTYFQRGNGQGYLHRDVWEYHNGPIPDGWHVHHVDGNPQNNDISNLECCPPEQHFNHHKEEMRTRGNSDKNLQHLEVIRKKAAEWHKSEEGIAWHQKVSGQYLKKARVALAEKRRQQSENPVLVKCVECQSEFLSPTGRAKVCSTACHCKRSRRKKREQKSEII